MRQILFSSVLSLFVLLLLVIAQVLPYPRLSAHNGGVPELSAWAIRTPTIDGNIVPSFFRGGDAWWAPEYHVPGEWEDAARVDFTLSYRGEDHNSTLYVKNDNVNLYVACRIEGEDYDVLDALRFHFDNDHNGSRDLGDNVLHISWFYRDAYIDNASIGSIMWDFADGGTRDGVGAAQFTPSRVYHFEAAFPLDTNDDAHDFSLSEGSTVGFLLTFFDYHGPADVDSDTWPSPLYDQMADIVITGPNNPLNGLALRAHTPPPTLDLSIHGIEVTQAIQLPDNSMPLVRGKLTVVRVYVDLGPTEGPVEVTVHIYGLDEFGQSLGALSQSFSAPQNPNRNITSHTANFLLPTSWIDRGSLTLTGFVKTVSYNQLESNNNNNWMARQTKTLHATEVPTIYIVPINCGTRLDPDLPSEDEIIEAEEYLRTIFPVADVNFVQLSWELIGENAPRASHTLNDLLTRIGLRLGLRAGGIDQIFGMTSKPEIWEEIYGVSEPLWWSEEALAIAASGVPKVAMVHEINHNWGPGADGPDDSWGRHAPGCGAENKGPDDNWPYPDGKITEVGFDTLDMIVVDPETPDFMTYCLAVSPYARKQAWISPYRWEKMLQRLDTGGGADIKAIQDTGEGLLISGWISQNGTGSLDPVFPFAASQEPSSMPSNYSLVLKDTAGTTLLVHSLHSSFINAESGAEDPWYFTALLPHQPGTAHVLLIYENSIVLDEIYTSPNPPIVQILSPNGGEEWNSGIQTITWAATDGDSDPLTYRIFHSPNNGNTWIPISPAVTQTSYQISTSALQGSETSLIQVVASDGFNIGQDESDAVFKVADKPPTARIIKPENETQFNIDDIILLRGRGTDLDDAILPETAYNWISSLDGYLGNGHTLTVKLKPGTHQITLTVTDINSNIASDTIIVKVTPGHEITSVTPSKTVVGQGLIMPINISVENLSPVTNILIVTVKASSPIYTAEVDPLPQIVTLPPGNSATLMFAWNTTDFPKGNYTLSALAEGVTADVGYVNGWALATISGDVDGDRRVDMRDIGAQGRAFGATPIDPRWNSNADINGDNKIDMRDIGIAARNFGQSW